MLKVIDTRKLMRDIFTAKEIEVITRALVVYYNKTDISDDEYLFVASLIKNFTDIKGGE